MKAVSLFVASLALVSTSAFADNAPAASAPATPPSPGEVVLKCVADGASKDASIPGYINDTARTAVAKQLSLPAPKAVVDPAAAMKALRAILAPCLETSFPFAGVKQGITDVKAGKAPSQEIQDLQDMANGVSLQKQIDAIVTAVVGDVLTATPYIKDNVTAGKLTTVDDPALKDLVTVVGNEVIGSDFPVRHVMFVIQGLISLSDADRNAVPSWDALVAKEYGL